MSLTNCDLLSPSDRHSRNRENLNNLSPKEKNFTDVVEIILLQKKFLKCVAVKLGPLPFPKLDIVTTKISEHWGLTKEDLSLCKSKYFFTVGRHVPKIWLWNIFLTFFCSKTVIFDLPETNFSIKEKIQVCWGLRKEKP